MVEGVETGAGGAGELQVSDLDVYHFFQRYYFHQDQLSWGRTQVLLAVQAGTLAASFSVHSRYLAVLVLLLGLWLTTMVYLVMRRDWEIQAWLFTRYLEPAHRRCGFESELAPVPGHLGGRKLLTRVVLVILAIDAILATLNMFAAVGGHLAGFEQLLPR